MKIRRAIIIKGSEVAINEGINDSYWASVIVEGEILRAAVKTMSLEQITAECLGSMVLRAWGLPVPEPLLIEGEPIRVASLDAEYPNLKQKIGLHEGLDDLRREKLISIGSAIASSFPTTPLALAADEAIGNIDRNLGNILWDGLNEAFIDHEKSFGLSPEESVNKLAQMAIACGEHERVKNSAVVRALALNSSPLQQIDISPLNSSHNIQFLEERLKGLASKVLARFPRPNDLFATM